MFQELRLYIHVHSASSRKRTSIPHFVYELTRTWSSDLSSKCVTFDHTIGQSLDPQGNIQLEAGASGTGGVAPTDAIPRTKENVVGAAQFALKRSQKAAALGTDVEMEFAKALLLGGEK